MHVCFIFRKQLRMGVPKGSAIKGTPDWSIEIVPLDIRSMDYLQNYPGTVSPA